MPRLLLYDIGHVENFGDRLVHELVTAALGMRVGNLEIIRFTSVDSEVPIPGYLQLSRTD